MGKFHILDWAGNLLFEADLPPSWSDDAPDDWNGGLAAPTLADIDGDYELEALLNTATAGVVAYDLPGTSQARILWGTGRWNFQRTASFPPGTLASSTLSAQPKVVQNSDIITYSIRLENPFLPLPVASFTDTLPAGITLVGQPTVSSGVVDQIELLGQGGQTVITWSGPVSAAVPVVVTITARSRRRIRSANLSDQPSAAG